MTNHNLTTKSHGNIFHMSEGSYSFAVYFLSFCKETKNADHVKGVQKWKQIVKVTGMVHTCVVKVQSNLSYQSTPLCGPVRLHMCSNKVAERVHVRIPVAMSDRFDYTSIVLDYHGMPV